MTKHDHEAVRLLGLPGIGSSLPGDDALVNAYREFCASLQVNTDGASVSCDSRFFDSREQAAIHGRDEPIDESRLKLLATLVSPDQEYLELIRSRVCGRAGTGRGRRAFEIFQGFLRTEVCRSLRASRPPGRTLLRLSGCLSTDPGLTWIQGVEVCSFGSDWAVDLHHGDYEDTPIDGLPKVLGFAAAAQLPRAVAAVLAHEPYYWTYDPTWLESDGCSPRDEQLPQFCWTRHGDSAHGQPGAGLGEHLLEMSDDDIDAFLDAVAGMSYDEVTDAVHTARERLDEDDDEGPASSGPLERLATIVARRG